ncbi:hypothetical protein [Cupriavidus consociatus]|uniref:hypothetical protein n=1 Tax=Cupriavidus consociatus TaxID=2821357 RepID=UPI001AE8147F|nr:MULTISPECIES: hypothetical protein [unclassified Cupriavidus]MBP0619868.1 hypothetical protein [Cupriavidus sp. LEh25]MDK2656522.1 hypothetical protein [Cupriavidus sp. LEh21]
MSPIVAGRFESIASAEEAARILFARGFSVWDVSITSVRPQGEARAGTQAEADTGKSAGSVMLAACVGNGLSSVVVDVLREAGASHLERAQGCWECGQWTDFDPNVRGEPVQDVEGEYWPRPLARESVAEQSTGNEDPGSELEHFVNQKRVEHD